MEPWNMLLIDNKCPSLIYKYAFSSLRVYTIIYISSWKLKQIIYITELMCFPGKDSSKAVVDVEAEVKDADWGLIAIIVWYAVPILVMIFCKLLI